MNCQQTWTTSRRICTYCTYASAVVTRKRTRAELIGLLDENLGFLRLSANAFDNGYETEAKRLASVLRTLLHQTRSSHSLLHQLKVQERWDFLDTASPINPENLLPTPGLVAMRIGNDGGRYIPLLGGGPQRRLRGFPHWWSHPVMKVDGTWSRKELVLMLANKEGGSHVDPDLDDRYYRLAKQNAVGWTMVKGDHDAEEPFRGDITAAAVRQIAYEVIETTGRYLPL